MSVLNGFKEFVVRGNAVDLAVGIVIGAAFTAVVNAIVTGFISPLVGAIFGQPNFDSVGVFTIGAGKFSLGIILTALINFILVAAAVYFAIVLPLNKLNSLRKPKALPEEVQITELQVLQSIERLLQEQRDKQS